jgi:hypothetical protein
MFDTGLERHVGPFFHGTATEKGLVATMECPVINVKFTVKKELRMSAFSQDSNLKRPISSSKVQLLKSDLLIEHPRQNITSDDPEIAENNTTGINCYKACQSRHTEEPLVSDNHASRRPVSTIR